MSDLKIETQNGEIVIVPEKHISRIPLLADMISYISIDEMSSRISVPLPNVSSYILRLLLTCIETENQLAIMESKDLMPMLTICDFLGMHDMVVQLFSVIETRINVLTLPEVRQLFTT